MEPRNTDGRTDASNADAYACRLTTVHTLSGLFDSYEEAQLTVHDLEDAGIPHDDVTIIWKASADASEADLTATGAGVGATLGGVGGLLAGMAGFAIPGIRPLMGAGWLVATLAGAAAGGVAGGIIAALIEAGIDEKDAHVFAKGVKRGGALITVRAHEHEVAAVNRILKRHHPRRSRRSPPGI
jgi:hypothetical protein